MSDHPREMTFEMSRMYFFSYGQRAEFLSTTIEWTKNETNRKQEPKHAGSQRCFVQLSLMFLLRKWHAQRNALWDNASRIWRRDEQHLYYYNP